MAKQIRSILSVKHLRTAVPLWLLFCPFYATGERPLLKAAVLYFGVFLLLAYAAHRACSEKAAEKSTAATVIAVILGIKKALECFFLPSAYPVLLPYQWLCGGAGLVLGAALAAVSLPELHLLLGFLSDLCQRLPRNAPASAAKPKLRRDRLWLFVTALVLITLCSKSSPLYPLNDWVDANCFFTVGKSLLRGLLPYRDLAEQKGPLIYYLHALAALPCFRQFWGVWLLEIAACFAFFWLLYRTVRLFWDGEAVAALTVLAILLYTSPAFCQGDSAEEFCLPLLAWGALVLLRCMKAEILPKKWEFFCIGLTSGCILWVKYSMLGFYLGWILAPTVLACRQRAWRSLLTGIGCIALGVAAVSAVVVLPFLRCGAGADLWNAYFYENIFAYGQATAGMQPFPRLNQIILTFNMFLIYGVLTVCIGILGMIFAKKRENRYVVLSYGGLWIGSLLLTVGMGKYYPYYTFSLRALLGMGCAVVCMACPRLRFPRRSAALAAAAALVLTAVLTPNRSDLLKSKSTLPQYRFRDTIAASGIDNPTLLNFNFLDGGFYTTAGIVPNVYYFCMLNKNHDLIEAAQRSAIEGGEIDFVVTQNQELDSPLYTLVDTADGAYEGEWFTYRLYRKQ